MPLRPLPLMAVTFACCIAMNVYLTLDSRDRLNKMEVEVKQRNSADPLVARECIEVDTGNSSDRPCLTTLRRLAQTPQQFHNRWVMVRGVYVSGFEQSALYPERLDSEVSTQELDRYSALWVHLDPIPSNDRPAITVVGRFSRGPAGHLGDYFGELTEATVWGRASSMTH